MQRRKKAKMERWSEKGGSPSPRPSPPPRGRGCPKGGRGGRRAKFDSSEIGFGVPPSREALSVFQQALTHVPGFAGSQRLVGDFGSIERTFSVLSSAPRRRDG